MKLSEIFFPTQGHALGGTLSAQGIHGSDRPGIVARASRQGFHVVVVSLLGLGAALCAALAWYHRVELFIIPHLWRQVREMAELRERQPGHPALAPTENRGLSPLDVAFSRLVRFQDPGFPGAKGVQLLSMQSEEGRQVCAVRY